MGLRGELAIDLASLLRIEELDLRLQEMPRCFVEAATEQLRERICRLALQGELLPPPFKQRAALLLDLLLAWIRARVEAKALVRIRLLVFAPAIPLARIVRKFGQRR